MLCAFKSCSIWCQEAGLLKCVSRWLKRSSLKSSGSRLCAVRWLRVWRMPLREVSTDTFRWSPSVTIEASQITAVHPQLSPRCVQWRGICRSKTSGKPIFTICPMRRATSSTRSVIITKSFCPRIAFACCASCTLMAPSSPTLELHGREHSNCTAWAQRLGDPKLRSPGNEAFGLFVRRMGSCNTNYRRKGLMKIAQVAPLFESVPPQYYGGTERVVSYLTEELVRQGHEVTLFASGDSVTKARLVSACRRSLRLDKHCVDQMAHHILLLEQVFRRADQFDVVHFHVDYLHFALSRRQPTAHVTTLYGRLDIP